jgi:hypothetical protein
MGDQNRIELLGNSPKAVLDLPPNKYASLVIVSPQLKKISPIDKIGIKNVKINIKYNNARAMEIQLACLPDLLPRFVCYLSKMITEQSNSGKMYL